MNLSDKMIEAMDLIEEMQYGDPNGVIKTKLKKLRAEVPEDELKYFDDLWEAYIAKT